MKVSTDSLIAALLHPRLFLTGDEDGGVGIHCRDHFNIGRPLAYYDHTGMTYPGQAVTSVTTIPSLWAEAVKHLDSEHRAST